MKVGLLGIGKLGLCFALNLDRVGYEVVGIDIHEGYVRAINDRSFQSPEPGVNEMLAKAQKLSASTDIQHVLTDDIDLIFVMVATPSKPDGTYDHEQVERIVSRLIEHGKRNHTVDLVVSCTTMPGYCNELAERLQPFNYKLSYNPEFIAQGSIIYDQQFPDQVLIGEADEESGDRVQAIYERICLSNPTMCRMDLLSAEICKLATNCFLTTKISFANSIGDLARSVGADEKKILDAVGSDSRVGKKYLGYGFGYGGPCLSRDNRALGIYADQQGFDLKISKATDAVNDEHLDFQFEEWLNHFPEEEVIEFEHVSYKKGSVSVEESQQLALAIKLARAGRKVLIKDRPEVVEQVEALYPGLFMYGFVKA
jgi:nucleotide sugar dehydrogenase